MNTTKEVLFKVGHAFYQGPELMVDVVAKTAIISILRSYGLDVKEQKVEAMSTEHACRTLDFMVSVVNAACEVIKNAFEDEEN